MLADYLAENSPYKPAIDGRITKIDASVAAAEAEATTPDLPEMSKTIASEAPKAIEETMEKAGEAVEAVTEGAKEMAEKAADDAGEAMAKMTEATEDAAKDAGEAMTADKNTHTVCARRHALGDRPHTLWRPGEVEGHRGSQSAAKPTPHRCGYGDQSADRKLTRPIGTGPEPRQPAGLFFAPAATRSIENRLGFASFPCMIGAKA